MRRYDTRQTLVAAFWNKKEERRHLASAPNFKQTSLGNKSDFSLYHTAFLVGCASPHALYAFSCYTYPTGADRSPCEADLPSYLWHTYPCDSVPVASTYAPIGCRNTTGVASKRSSRESRLLSVSCHNHPRPYVGSNSRLWLSPDNSGESPRSNLILRKNRVGYTYPRATILMTRVPDYVRILQSLATLSAAVGERYCQRRANEKPNKIKAQTYPEVSKNQSAVKKFDRFNWFLTILTDT